MKKLIVLDFSSGEVNVFNYDENIYDDFENFAEENPEYELNPNDCQWMITNELTIKIN